MRMWTLVWPPDHLLVLGFSLTCHVQVLASRFVTLAGTPCAVWVQRRYSVQHDIALDANLACKQVDSFLP